MGICSAKLDTSTPEGKLKYIFQHFDEDNDMFLCESEYVKFASKMGNKMFDPDGWCGALAEYGQGWVCDSDGGIPYDGILMMCAYERGALFARTAPLRNVCCLCSSPRRTGCAPPLPSARRQPIYWRYNCARHGAHEGRRVRQVRSNRL